MGARTVRSYSSRSLTTVVAVATICIFAALTLRAEPVEIVIDNGSPLNRIDIVVMGDGYTTAEMGKFRTDARNLITSFFSEEPLREYQPYFNARLIEVASEQSGADHPEQIPPVFVNTALDAAYNCGGISRSICVNTAKVYSTILNSLGVSEGDIVIVLVNDPVYGGTGGGPIVASADAGASEIVLHEFAHNFAGLADEYPGGGECDKSIEPLAWNVTRQTVRNQIKWRLWIDPSTPIPTTAKLSGVPGLYEGAQYCSTGLYRPTLRSKMYALGFPFEQVNTELLAKQIVTTARPVDGGIVNFRDEMRIDETVNLSVSVTQPRTHSLSVEWRADAGRVVGTGSEIALRADVIGRGVHQLEVIVRDNGPFLSGGGTTVFRTQRQVYVRPYHGNLFDYDGDFRADLSVWRPSNGRWYIRGSFRGYFTSDLGREGDFIVPADYDGDFKTETWTFRPSTGMWSFKLFLFFSFPIELPTTQTRWGQSGDYPLPMDRVGRGYPSKATYKSYNHAWYSATSPVKLATFGVDGDKPVLGDFDGDRIDDVAVFRPSNSTWYIQKTAQGFYVQTWGEPGDIPVTEDFDGDGVTDAAVFRPSNGRWYVSRSSGGFYSQEWGQAGDIPVPADYDADGRADLAVFRPTNGTWYLARTSEGISVQQFGQAGDVPTQSAYQYWYINDSNKRAKKIR